MEPRILDGALVTVRPCAVSEPSPGDVVLCRIGPTAYLHLVQSKANGRLCISNNKGRINGWTTAIYGIVTEVSA